MSVEPGAAGDESQPIRPMRLAGAPGVVVARVGLGLTVYLDEPLAWAREGAAAVLALFREVTREAPATWVTTSALDAWVPVASEPGQAAIQALSSPLLAHPRHLHRFQLADDVQVPSVGFSYQEIDEGRALRTGVLEVVLPQDHAPEDLLRIASEIAARWPVWCGVGGYRVGWNEHEKLAAFGVAYRWCRRYLGLDVQDPSVAAWAVREGLPSVNWLTLVGTRCARALGLRAARLASPAPQHGVEVLALAQGTLVRAGAAPSLGDRNRMRPPLAYAEAARRLERGLHDTLPPYWGPFQRDHATRRWARRFLDPGAWR